MEQTAQAAANPRRCRDGWRRSARSRRRKALGLGATLSTADPKNLALTFAASAAIANAQLSGADTTIAIVAFVAIGSITVVGAVAFYLVSPAKAEKPLAAVKQFMADNNATIMMVILLVLGAKLARRRAGRRGADDSAASAWRSAC